MLQFKAISKKGSMTTEPVDDLTNAVNAWLEKMQSQHGDHFQIVNWMAQSYDEVKVASSGSSAEQHHTAMTFFALYDISGKEETKEASD